MATRKAKISFSVKRFISFLKVFKRNKRGLVGIAILVFFIGFALAAPILAPYDPVNDKYLSGDYAYPFWFKYIPGQEPLPENYEMLTQPGFITPESLLDEWNFDVSTSSADVSMQYVASRGSSNIGCAAISFKRQAGTQSGKVIAHLTKSFYYPHRIRPMRFTSKIAVLTEDIEDLNSVDITVFINRIENESYAESYPLWTKTVYITTERWITPSPPIDSYASKKWVQQYFGGTGDPAKIVFSKPTNYTYDVQVTFRDLKPGTLGKDLEATVYIDDLNVNLYGRAFGLLGTDQWGRDIYSQLVHGSRISLFVGLLSAVLSVTIGLLIGLVCGYLGKVVDEILMRFTDMLLVLPSLPLLLVLVAVLGPSIWNLIMLIGLLGWMGFARTVRSMAISLKERPFVEAAKAVGAGKFHIILRHILPNVMNLVYVSLALSVPSAILAEAALSWLGLFDPSVMSWGRMLHDVTAYVGYDKYWWVIPPGICIALISLSFILLGYTLDEILNPRLRRRR